jgi:hypothetical protein
MIMLLEKESWLVVNVANNSLQRDFLAFNLFKNVLLHLNYVKYTTIYLYKTPMVAKKGWLKYHSPSRGTIEVAFECTISTT